MNKIIVRHPEPEMKAREKLAYKFYELIFKEDEYPESVLDDDELHAVCCNLWDKYKGNYREYIMDRVLKLYGIKVIDDDFSVEFWQILDYLEAEQIRFKTQKLLPKP